MGEWAVAWRQQGEGAGLSVSYEASGRVALERQCAAAEAVFQGLGLAGGRSSGRSPERTSSGGSARLIAGWMARRDMVQSPVA